MEAEIYSGREPTGKGRGFVAVTSDDLPRWEKPNCPECGNRMASRGNVWHCHDCGKDMVKVWRKRLVTDTPPCPYCDNKLMSKGKDWYCPSCLKWITKAKLERMMMGQKIAKP